ncbi:MAG: peptidase U32 family protein [Bacteroidales bacterium]|nr:peptidase U32 family protein [Bacteroidales bacterium]
MKRKIELLAPGGDIDSIKAAIVAGADAVYCGLDKFNARNRATNISSDDLNGILRLAHKHKCQVFLTLNILITENEIPAFTGVLNKLVNTSIDGIIVQDLGMFYLLAKYFKRLKIHASTQFTTHNEGQVKFLSKLAAERVNLSRELNIDEIKALTLVAHQNNILTEVFVHGSNCISFSGQCYMSSVHGGNSGNRGRCSQPCRDQYLTTAEGKNFPLNLKDNSAFTDLKELSDAGVDSLKIEGRIKKFHYVYTVVEAWRKQLTRFYSEDKLTEGTNALRKVFNRDFTNDYLKGEITKNMFIDNPRDNSAIYLSEINGGLSEASLEKAKGDVYDERTEIITSVEKQIAQLSIAKAPLQIFFSGIHGSPLKVLVTTPDTSYEVFSEVNLSDTGTEVLNQEVLLKRFKILNETEYLIERVDLQDLHPNVYLPFKELTAIKKKLLFILNDSREYIEPIAVPVLKKLESSNIKPKLSVLISSAEDLYLTDETSATIYFQLPDSIKNSMEEFVDLFKTNTGLIPWFPSIIIGEDYRATVEFLDRLKPKCIVTNNTGIAFEAFKKGISWIAGPQLNTINSFSLLCLKENFNCSGAFISNEISKMQMQGIKKPDDFELFYSIFHPIVLMTSRQCLFHQVTGCWKDAMDETCIPGCARTASTTNMKNTSFVIEKSKGSFNTIYNDINFLNTDIVADLPGFYSGLMVDLRDIKTGTKTGMDKAGTIRLFENMLNGAAESKKELEQTIYPTTKGQYKKGI